MYCYIADQCFTLKSALHWFERRCAEKNVAIRRDVSWSIRFTSSTLPYCARGHRQNFHHRFILLLLLFLPLEILIIAADINVYIKTRENNNNKSSNVQIMPKRDWLAKRVTYIFIYKSKKKNVEKNPSRNKQATNAFLFNRRCKHRQIIIIIIVFYKRNVYIFPSFLSWYFA